MNAANVSGIYAAVMMKAAHVIGNLVRNVCKNSAMKNVGANAMTNHKRAREWLLNFSGSLGMFYPADVDSLAKQFADVAKEAIAEYKKQKESEGAASRAAPPAP